MDMAFERTPAGASADPRVTPDQLAMSAAKGPTSPSELANAPLGWVDLTLQHIPLWQERVSDAYVRWAVADQALRAARQDCATMDAPYKVTCLRPRGASYERTPLATWDPHEACHRHDDAVSAGLRLAMRDTVDEIERCILQAYEILLLKGPNCVLTRPEEQGLMRIYLRRGDNPRSWNKSWSIFMASWRKDRTPSEARNVVSRYWSDAQLFVTDGYDRDAVHHFNNFVAVLLDLRDHIRDGHYVAQPTLSRLSEAVDTPGFSYDEGQALDISRGQLELVEAFFAEYLTMLSLSLKLKSTMAPM